jgi:DNA-binding protein Fis
LFLAGHSLESAEQPVVCGFDNYLLFPGMKNSNGHRQSTVASISKRLDEKRVVETLSGPDRRDSSSPAITVEALKSVILKSVAQALLREAQLSLIEHASSGKDSLAFFDEVRRFEINLIERALLQTGGSQVRAASLLGMKKSTLHSKVKVYKIEAKRFFPYIRAEGDVSFSSRNETAADTCEAN